MQDRTLPGNHGTQIIILTLDQPYVIFICEFYGMLDIVKTKNTLLFSSLRDLYDPI